MFNYILTSQGVTIVSAGRSVTLPSDDEFYPAVIEAIKNEDEQALNEALTSKAEKIANAGRYVGNAIEVQGGTVLFRGKELHGSIVPRILQMLGEGFDLNPLVAFLDKLANNPSYRAVKGLYAFLEHGKMPITKDGDFLAYKAIRSDWRDIHSGTFDNSLGAVVEMPRNRVNEDPNQTCSAGLHVCSYDYLPHFAHADGRVVVVKVNPADVVAIPSDYNNTKMRVARYEVIEEVTDWYKKNENVLAQKSVWSRDIDDEALDEDDSDEQDEQTEFVPEYWNGKQWIAESGSYDSEEGALDAYLELAEVYQHARIAFYDEDGNLINVVRSNQP